MKKRQLLSLLLALVLAFSAAGTAFAASGSGSAPAGPFGTLTCTIKENYSALEWSVTVTAEVTNTRSSGILAVGAAFNNLTDPAYYPSSPGKQSYSWNFLIPVSLESKPTVAYGYAEAYYPGKEIYKADAMVRLTN